MYSKQLRVTQTSGNSVTFASTMHTEENRCLLCITIQTFKQVRHRSGMCERRHNSHDNHCIELSSGKQRWPNMIVMGCGGKLKCKATELIHSIIVYEAWDWEFSGRTSTLYRWQDVLQYSIRDLYSKGLIVSWQQTSFYTWFSCKLHNYSMLVYKSNTIQQQEAAQIYNITMKYLSTIIWVRVWHTWEWCNFLC